MSILGGIQPSRLEEYLRDARKSGAADDGLMQRFQLAVWPDMPPTWKNVDRWPETEARKQAFAIFQRLSELKPEDVGATVEEGETPFLRFTPAAQELFDSWRTNLEGRLRSDTLPTCLESHLAKHRSLVPCLSLVFHLVNGGRGPVPKVTLELALRWAEYLESHANRIYAGTVNPGRLGAREVVRKIRSSDLPMRFTLREVYRPNWSALSTAEDASAAVELLTKLHWLREEEERTGGRPTTWFTVNPKVLATPQNGTDKTDKSLPGTLLSVLSVHPEAPSEESQSPEGEETFYP